MGHMASRSFALSLSSNRPLFTGWGGTKSAGRGRSQAGSGRRGSVALRAPRWSRRLSDEKAPPKPPPLLAKVLDTTGQPATSTQAPVAAAAASLPAGSPWKRWKKS